MSNDALKPDIHAIQNSVVDVLSQVRDLMNYASKNLVIAQPRANKD